MFWHFTWSDSQCYTKKLEVTLSFLATGNSYRNLQNLFRVSKSAMVERAEISVPSIHICHIPEAVSSILSVRHTVAAYNPTHKINVSLMFVTELPPTHYSEYVGVGLTLWTCTRPESRPVRPLSQLKFVVVFRSSAENSEAVPRLCNTASPAILSNVYTLIIITTEAT
jgi:hypothetical protein